MFTGLVLPRCIDLQWSGSMGFSTQVAIMASGAEQRNQEWEGQRAEYTIAYSARNQEHWSEVRRFIGIHAGRAHTFLLIDPADYVCLAADGVFIEIDSTHAQMAKRYAVEGLEFYIVVTKPGEAILHGGSGATFDENTGIVTHATIPTSWESPLYYKHVRFDTDRLELTGITKQKNGQFLAGYRNVPLIEVQFEVEEEVS